MKTAENKGMIICADCGAKIPSCDAYETAAGELVCESCRWDNYMICDFCGELQPMDEVHELDDGSCLWCCDDCLMTDDSVVVDYQTDEIIKRCNAIWTYNCEYISQRNYEDNWFMCENCCEVYPIDEAIYSENNGCYYCEDCYEDEYGADYNEYVHDYHAGPRLTMRNPQHDALTIGFELELNGRSSLGLTDYINTLGGVIADDIYYKFERDGSLNNGVELISAPFGASQFNKVKHELEQVCEAAADTMSVTDNTGLHVHVNANYFGNIYERMFANCFINYVFTKDEGVTWITRREYNRWCQPNRELAGLLRNWDDLAGATPVQKLATFKDAYKKLNRSSHYTALNFGYGNKQNTFEFRLCKASKTPRFLFSEIYFCVGLAAKAKEVAHELFTTGRAELSWNICDLVLDGARLLGQDVEEITDILEERDLKNVVFA